MAKAFHTRESVESTFRKVRLLASELNAVMKLFDGKVEDEEAMQPYTGRLYVEGEKELQRALEKLGLWINNVRGELVAAIADPEGYEKQVSEQATMNGTGEPAKPGRRKAEK